MTTIKKSKAKKMKNTSDLFIVVNVSDQSRFMDLFVCLFGFYAVYLIPNPFLYK